MSDVTPIRVLIADDDPLARTGIRLLLGGNPQILVVGEADDGTEVAGLVESLEPQVVLMDVRMPRLDGIEATRRLAQAADSPAPAVIMLTTFDSEPTVLAALQAGAAGFLVKHAPAEEIVAAIRRAARGEPVFSADVLRTIVRRAQIGGHDHADPDLAAALSSLSNRDRAVARAVARGLSNTEIAAELYLSVGTVKAEVSDLLARLGVANRIQLAILADQHLNHPDPDEFPSVGGSIPETHRGGT